MERPLGNWSRTPVRPVVAGYQRPAHQPQAYTSKTITRIPQLKKAILKVRKDGYAIVDQELEAGLRSIAVPVTTRSHRVIAAINVGTHVSRIDYATLTDRCLPALQEGALALRNLLI